MGFQFIKKGLELIHILHQENNLKTFLQYFVQEEANPLDVDAYHGSGAKFSQFKQSKARVKNDFFGGGVAYFTDSKPTAKTYAVGSAKREKSEPHIYHTSLSMKNVFDVDHKFSGEKLTSLLPNDHESFARGAGLLPYGSDKHKVISDLRSGKTELTGHQVFKGLSQGKVKSDFAREHLKKKGYDGLRYNGGDNMNVGHHNVYVPYSPEAIRINKITKLVKKVKGN